MGKNKLKKFADLRTYACVAEYPRDLVMAGGCPLKGKWGGGFFRSPLPTVLELGCGKGEYTVGLARRHPDRNFIGIDIKGARIWTGATAVEQEQIPNAGFLRTEIEMIAEFFNPGEVSELWITFPDPQMKKTNKRLTSTRFLNSYRRIMPAKGIINLKTDSPFLYEYTRRLVALNGLELLTDIADLYADEVAPLAETDPAVATARAIQTHYELQWLSRGKTIKLLRFRLGDIPLTEPDISDLEPDDYRALPRFNPADKSVEKPHD